MPRPTRTGIRGLYWDENERLFRIDFRWRDARTGERHRYRERLPQTTKKPAAQRHMTEIVNLALAGKLRERKGDKPAKLDAALKRYLEDYVLANLGDRAHKDRKRHADLIVRHIGNKPLADLVAFDLERYKGARKKDGVEPATINREMATLKHFVGRAADWAWLDDAKAIAVRKVKLLKEPPGRVRYLSDDERARLYAKLPVSFRRVVLGLVLSGMRRSELVRLRKDQVDLATRTITLVKTKSNKVRRVPVNDALAAVLSDAMANTEPDSPWVFESRHKAPYTPDGVSSFFRKLCDDAEGHANIDDFHLHDLRHDFATQVRRGGAGLDVVAKLLGHSSLAMSQRYAHLGDEQLHASVAKLGAIAPAMPPAATKTRKNKAKAG
jgi:integrase